MPYRIIKNKGGSYSVVSSHGTKAKHTTLEKAHAQMRLLHMIDEGYKPAKKKKK